GCRRSSNQDKHCTSGRVRKDEIVDRIACDPAAATPAAGAAASRATGLMSRRATGGRRLSPHKTRPCSEVAPKAGIARPKRMTPQRKSRASHSPTLALSHGSVTWQVADTSQVELAAWLSVNHAGLSFNHPTEAPSRLPI